MNIQRLCVFLGAVTLLLLPQLTQGATLLEQKRALEQQSAEISRQLNAVRNQKATTEREKESKEQQIRSLEAQANSLSSELDGLNSRINEVGGQITEKETYINDASTSIEELNQKILARKSELKAIILDLYSRSLMKNGVMLAASSDNLSEIFDEAKYAEKMQTRVNELLQDITNHKVYLENERERYNSEKSTLATLRQELEQEKASLESSKIRAESLANQNKNEVEELEDNISSLSVQEQELNRKRVEASSALSRLEAQISARYGGGTVCSGNYVWPVAGGRITQGYGMTAYALSGAYGGGIHNGIDIAAPTGTAVYATSGGTAISVGFNNYTYGRWVVIRHDDGFLSLYGHLSRQSVSQGQRVSAGQQIGAVGSTGFSSGPHLHFTIYRSSGFGIGSSPYGASVNPSTCRF
jgi:murein DD-endopeptidase MepM/ murein hydrolase activator NlpD